MSRPSPSSDDPLLNMTRLLAMVEALRQHNENLHDSVQPLQTQTSWEDEFAEKPLDLQPLAEVVWEVSVPENFKPLPFPSFDCKSVTQEHIIAINNQTTIVGTSDSIKCKRMVRTFKDVVLRWYMSLPRAYVLGYSGLARKMVQYFSANKHRKVSSNSLFNECHGMF